jgi:hypothetical protein
MRVDAGFPGKRGLCAKFANFRSKMIFGAFLGGISRNLFLSLNDISLFSRNTSLPLINPCGVYWVYLKLALTCS